MNAKGFIENMKHIHPATGFRVSRHYSGKAFLDDMVDIWLAGSIAHLSRREGQLALGQRHIYSHKFAKVTVLSEPEDPKSLGDYWSAVVGPIDNIPSIHDEVFSGLTVEIVFGAAGDRELVFSALDEILAPNEAEVLKRIVSESIEAAPYEPHLRQRTPSAGLDWNGEELESTELYIPTVPFRGDTTITNNALHCQRILRLIKSTNLTVWLWSTPVGQEWSYEIDPDLRGIPRVSTATLAERTLRAATDARLNDCIDHIKYCIESLGASMSQWQSDVMEAIAKESDVFEISEFDSLRLEFGRIGTAVGMTESSLRANSLRAKEDYRVLRDGRPESESDWDNFLKEWEETSAQFRDRQTDMAALLASLASGLQAYSADKLSSRFGIVAATVLLPSLVLAFFGTNLDILSQGAHGQLPQVLLWCGIAVVISSMFLVRQVDRQWRKSFVAAGGVAIVAVFLSWFPYTKWSTLLPMLVLSLSLLTLGLLGRIRSKKQGEHH